MIHPRHVLATLLVAFAALPGCSLDGPVVCGDHADCISCAEDASCQWCGDSCKPLAADACDWPTATPQACADWPPQACVVDASGGPCPTGICTEGYCAYQISGTRLTTYWRPDSTTQTVCDGEPFVVVAYWDVAGMPRTATATADFATCSFHLPPTPGGPVTVVLEQSGKTPVAVETTHSFLDFGYDAVGIPGIAIAGPGTGVDMTVDGLEPWTVEGTSNLEDEVQFWTTDGYFAWGTSTSAGSTSLAWSLDWEGSPLFSSSAGDLGIVTQLADRSSGGWEYKVLSRYGTFPLIDLANGSHPAATAPIAAATTTGTVTLDWRFSDFAAYQSQMSPGAADPFYEAYVSENFQTLATQVAYAPDLLYMYVPAGLTNAVAGPLSFGLIPRSDFQQCTEVGFYASVTKSLPGLSAGRVFASIMRGFAGAGSVVATPLVSPPQSIRLGGWLDAMIDQSGVGTTPEVSWLPPFVGTPAAYQVSVAKLYADGSSTRIEWVMRMVTDQTSVRIPPGVLQPGNTYFLRVTAEVGADFVGAPNDSAGFPRASASAVTANFTP